MGVTEVAIKLLVMLTSNPHTQAIEAGEDQTSIASLST